MNIAGLDLNLLLAFDAVFRRRNVSRAASDLGLTQGSVSNALRRLRDALDDPLFVRGQRGVEPTPFAEQLAPYVRQALALVEQGLEETRVFDPAKQERVFTVIMSDIAAAVVLPPVLSACWREAPGVSIRAVDPPVDEAATALRAGTVDLAAGFLPELGAGFEQRALFTTHYVCIAAADHPSIRGAIALDDFASAGHVMVEIPASGHVVVENKLEALGLTPKIGARVSHFLAAALIVSATDMVATVPLPLARLLAANGAVQVLKHPVDFDPIDMRLVWHERFRRDPSNLWLRQLMARVIRSIDWR